MYHTYTVQVTSWELIYIEPSIPTHCTPSYLIEQGVCYLVLCEGAFPKKLAFAYLEELQTEFHELYGKKVAAVSRPYSFIEFGRPPNSDLHCAYIG